MWAHRFRELVDETSIPPVTTAAVNSAFVPCPIQVFSGPDPAQQAFIQEVYRIAQERTQAQLESRRTWLPAFSMN